MKSLLSAVAMLCFAGTACGYTFITGSTGLPVKWQAGTVTMQVKLGAPPLTDGSDYAAAMQTAMQTWNAQIGSVQLSPQILGAGTAADGNQVNEVVFSGDIFGEAFDSSTLAVTTTWLSGSRRVEADMLFNTAWSWGVYGGAQQARVDFRRVAIHELGHVLGLDHPDEAGQNVSAIMNAFISNIDTVTADDIAGAQVLYGTPGSAPPAPANDNFASAFTITLSGNTAQVSGTNVSATKEAGEPDHDPGSGVGGASVWWKWTAPGNGSLVATTAGSSFDTLLGAYTGGSVGSLNQLASNDDESASPHIQTSKLTLPSLSGGTMYYFAVDGWNAETGAIVLNLSFTPAPVNTAPSITSQPASQSVTAGLGVQFTVSANGTPFPGYQWQRLPAGGGAWGDLSNGGSYSGVTTSILSVSGAILAMNGDLFRCVATNSAGSAISNIASLTVNPPPVAPGFILQPAGQAVVAGANAGFSVAVSGTAPFAYRWQVLFPGGAWTDLTDNGTYTGAATANLSVATVAAMDGYSYRCVASNVAGSTISSAALLTVTAAVPPAFSLPLSQLDLCVVAGINHFPVRLPITLNPGVSAATLSVSASASWVSASIDPTGPALVLTFTTQNLVSATNTATVSLSRPGESPLVLQVRGLVSVANIISLTDDPFRSRTYGIHQNALGLGAVVVFDPIQSVNLGCVTVGNKPGDLAISADGQEMLVINSAGKSISAVDLGAVAVKQTIALTDYSDWGPSDTTAHIQYGPGNIIYYTDGTWAPVLRVFNRSTQTVMQTLMLDGSAPNNNGGFGFGDFVTTPDKTFLFAWGQYGWSAGLASSTVAKFSIASNGTLTLAQTASNLTYPGFQRDPLNTPALMTADGAAVFIKQLEFFIGSVASTAQAFPSPVYAISPLGEIASTASGIYEVATGNKLYSLTPDRPVQAITSDYARLVYYDSVTRQLGTVNLFDAIGTTILGRNLSPADGAVVLAPAMLRWTSQPGIDRYRIYLGTSSAAVASATTASPEYLGEAVGSSLNLGTTLAAGITYYWRIDPVSQAGVTTGQIFHFTVATIAASRSSIDTSTVQGHANHTVSLDLTSAVAGKLWTASASVPWISFGVASGVTPATLQVRLDASALPVGVNQASVTITASDGSFVLPVKLRVDPLTLTMMRSVPGSTKVYAVSEENAAAYTGTSRAYLLEIDTLFKRIDRVVSVGTGVTDFAVHQADGRIYVTNWKVGSLLAINRATFSLERTYAFAPFAGTGYGSGDVYRVSAGVAGRLVVEPEDQWINVAVFDTVTGSVLATTSQREGGGAYDPAGRYYYHGDNNISNASIHKLDTAGDVFTPGTINPVKGVNYYGSRTLIVTEDGRRVFWNGIVYDENLISGWSMGAVVNSASSDGRYSFSSNQAYDITTKSVVATLPATATVSAFNSVTGRLAYQQGTTLGFYTLPNAVLPNRSRTPTDGAIVSSPSSLQWSPVPGATGYRVYLGQSPVIVAAATTTSPEYLGQSSSPSLALSSALAAGRSYYWRIDVVVGAEIAVGDVQGFGVSAVVPGASSIDVATVKGQEAYRVDLPLTAPAAGIAWSVTTGAPWIHFDQASGVTPATLHVFLDTRALGAGANSAGITLTAGAGSLVIPVKLQVDPLALTVIKTDPNSIKAYAVSEENAAAYTGTSRAYLLEIDTQAEKITRVVPVGTGVTDLAVHAADGRIYVPNWQVGTLMGVNLASFAVERQYQVPPFSGVGYSTSDAYRVSAGGPGRLIFEGEDQWIRVSLFDTAAGQVLTTSGQREGGGGYEPAGRYYYHGDDNSSGAEIHKLDSAGDQLVQTAHARVSTFSYYGSRSVVVSGDGSRVFWNGSAFDPNLNVLWSVADDILCCSADGRWAFGQSQLYDTVQQRTVAALPFTSRVSAFNSTTGKLVAQQGSGLAFYALSAAGVFGVPAVTTQPKDQTVAPGSSVVLFVQVSSPTAASFQWQVLPMGSGSWANSSNGSGFSGSQTASLAISGATFADNGSQYRCVVTNAVGTVVSNVATLTVAIPMPVITGQPLSQGVLIGSPVDFSVTATSQTVMSYQWRKGGLDIPGATTATYHIASFQPGDAGSYTVVVTNSAGSVTSNAAILAVALPPTITTQPATQTIIAGNPVTFGVTATSNAALSYQWRKGGTPIPGATAATYTIPSAGAGDAADYSVVVSNIAGFATSATATLTVQLPPSITQQPANQSVLTGGTATFTVAATSTTTTSYQWQRLPAGSGTWTNASGAGFSSATGPTLTASSLAIGSNGDQFRCIVTNVAGSVTSNAAALSVAPAGFTKLSAGRYHSLRLDINAGLYATGVNLYGQLGLGNTTAYTSPQPVALSGQTIADEAAGAQHSLILTTAKDLWVTGYNGSGQLGDGTLVAKSTPFKLATNIAGMAAAVFHSAYLKTDGTLWMVGGNDSGQLGNGTLVDSTTATQVATGVIDVTLGNRQSFFLKSDGTLWGMGDMNCSGVPVSTPVQVATNVTAFSAGAYHCLILKTDGTLWSTGYNAYGQLGNGTTTDSPTPVPIATNVKAVAAGYFFSVFLKGDGTLWATGYNSFGQLGDGTTTARSVPYQLATNVTAVSASESYTLFTKVDGSLWGTGLNGNGQFGNGIFTTVSTPVQISPGVVLAPVAPTGLTTSTAASLDRVHLIWSPAADARTYEVWRNTVNDSSAATRLAQGVRWAIYEDLTAISGQSYFYWIKAVNPAGTSAFSAPVLGASGNGTGPAAPPVFTSQPQAQVVGATVDAVFVVVASGTSPLSYQWQQLSAGDNTWYDVGDNGSGSPTGLTSYFTGSHTATLTVHGTYYGISGDQYRCVVSNAAGRTTSNAAFLSVTAGGLTVPSITNQPGTTTVSAGTMAVFSIAANGSAALSYSWEMAPVDLSFWVALADNSIYSGADTNSLAVSTLPTLNGYHYRCVVRNPAGYAISNVAGLTVTGGVTQAPTITSAATLVGMVGQLAAYQTVATDSPSSYGFSWIAPSAGQFSFDVTTGLFTQIPTATGTYSFAVTATNALGTASKTVTFTVATSGVVAGPVITGQPPAAISTLGGTGAGFQVVAAGTAPLSYQWQVAPPDLSSWTDLTNNSTYSGADTAELQLLATIAMNGYHYRCVVSNGAGSSTSNVTTLTVNQLVQNITFAALADTTYTTTPFTLFATASSGLPVSFTILSGPASLSGHSLTFTGIGTVTVRASQGGNATYSAAANVDRSFNVTKAPTTVTLAGLNPTYDGAAHGATATTNPLGLTVIFTYDGSATVPVNAGSYAVVGTISDANYQGSASGALAIAKADQTISFTGPANQAFSVTPITLSATATSGLTVTFAVASGPAAVGGTTLTLTGSGTVTVRASQTGDANRNAAPDVDQTFTVIANYSSWQQSHFTADELLNHPELTGPNAVYGHDGLPNLVKYALGLEPKQDITTGLPVVSTTATDWTYTYTRPSDTTDVTYEVEMSTNLTTWTTAGVTHEQVSTGAGTETWRGRYPLASAANVFFRLKVTRP